jgi:phosphatidylserine/phosphatidylglycerophosphate/cardiolipin synthase-like enzyme
VLLDALSSHVKDTTMAAAVYNCRDKTGNINFEYRVFNPIDFTIHDITQRTHEKMLAADGEIMIVGGRNVDEKYFGMNKKRNFKDLDILISGPVVQTARNYYLALWDKKASVKEVNLDKFNPEKLEKKCELAFDPYCKLIMRKYYERNKRAYDKATSRMENLVAQMKKGQTAIKYDSKNNLHENMHEFFGVRFLHTSPFKKVGSKNMDISNELYSLFSKAQKNVLILSPYLIPTKRAEKLFEDLTRRGVHVTIITNSLKSTDNLFAQAGFKAAKDKMVEMGIELYEYNLVDTAHAKAAVIDDEIALIGTYNMDPRSAQINREIGIVIQDKSGSIIIKELIDIIGNFKKESLLVGINGQKVNENIIEAEVSSFKKGGVKLIEQIIILPPVKNQL